VNQLVLLGDVSQVQKLVERPRHRQYFIVAQGIQNGFKLLARGTAPVILGPLANTLDLGEKRFAVLVTNRITQQLTQQVNIIAQACINIGHQQFLQQIAGGQLMPKSALRGLLLTSHPAPKPVNLPDRTVKKK